MKIFWDQPPTRPWMSIILILLDFWLILTSYSWFKYLNGFILWLLCVVWLVVVLSTINYCNWTFSGLLGPCIKHISAKNGDFRTKMPLIGDYHHIMVSPYLDSFVHVSHGPLKRFWRWAHSTPQVWAPGGFQKDPKEWQKIPHSELFSPIQVLTIQVLQNSTESKFFSQHSFNDPWVDSEGVLTPLNTLRPLGNPKNTPISGKIQ